VKAGEVAITLEDASLLERCRRGEPFAWTALLQRYQDRIYNVCWRIAGDAEEAADLTQDVFVTALEKIGGFEERSGFFTWLYRIAVNLSLTRRRQRGRRRTLPIRDGQDGDGEGPALHEPVDRRCGPMTQALDRETAEAVSRAVDQLDDEHRTVLVLRDVESLDYAEIAAILEVPSGTVKSRLFRARLALREALGPDFATDAAERISS